MYLFTKIKITNTILKIFLAFRRSRKMTVENYRTRNQQENKNLGQRDIYVS